MTKTNRAPYYGCIIPDKIFQTSNAEINIQTLLSQSCRYSRRGILCCPISGIIYYQYFPVFLKVSFPLGTLRRLL